MLPGVWNAEAIEVAPLEGQLRGDPEQQQSICTCLLAQGKRGRKRNTDAPSPEEGNIPGRTMAQMWRNRSVLPHLAGKVYVTSSSRGKYPVRELSDAVAAGTLEEWKV